MPDEQDPKNEGPDATESDDSLEEEPSRDLPGFSSIFTTTQSGLKRIRKARGSIDPDLEDEVTADVPPPVGEDADEDGADPEPPPAEEEFTPVEDGPTPPPPPEPQAAEPPHEPEADIEVSGGLSMVETAEMPARPAQATAAPEPPTPPTPPTPPAPPADRPEPPPPPAAEPVPTAKAAPPTPPEPRTEPSPKSGGVSVHPGRSPSRPGVPHTASQTDAALPVVDTTYPDAPSASGSSNWLLYLVVILVVVGMVGALILTVISLK